jgi:hypothetical protein
MAPPSYDGGLGKLTTLLLLVVVLCFSWAQASTQAQGKNP